MKNMASLVHKDRWKMRLDGGHSSRLQRNFVNETLLVTSQLMLHNPGDSGGVSSRNNGENWSFCKVVYTFIYHPQSGVYAIFIA